MVEGLMALPLTRHSKYYHFCILYDRQFRKVALFPTKDSASPLMLLKKTSRDRR